LERPDLMRGRAPADVRRLLEHGLNPEQWKRAPVRKGEGTRWYDGQGRSFAIERQPRVGGKLHKGWYLKVANDGRIVRIPLEGNPELERGIG
jgi:hypothetical protein